MTARINLKYMLIIVKIGEQNVKLQLKGVHIQLKKCDDTPKIYLTTENPPWDTWKDKNSVRETGVSDHQGQIIITAKIARVLVFINRVILYSQANDAIDVIDRWW